MKYSRPLMVLTSRERQVLKLTAENHTTKTIANELGIAEKTVQSFRSRAGQKLGLTGIAALTQYALKNGLASWIV